MPTDVRWAERDVLFPTAAAERERVDVVLGIGSGVQPRRMINPRVHICADPFPEHLVRLRSQTAGAYDRDSALLNADRESATRLLPERSVDTVFLLEVIEDPEQDAGRELSRRTEPLATRRVVIFTPLGLVPQHHPAATDAWGLGGGMFLENRSGWLPDDFDERWRIIGARLRRMHASGVDLVRFAGVIAPVLHALTVAKRLLKRALGR